MVQSVEAGSLAAKAGLLPVRRTLSGVVPGDVIVSVNGRPVKTVGEYTAAIDEVSIGETVRLGIEREGTPMDLSLTVDSA
jgi:S1-C subfamily serine protease|mmetsp:Transcript_34125/g.60936  ORF Transcript_34125/g.60936 Transcript_34125/m.60936 type:complete len:80 (-) Transcript_34125:139-378(-)|eukprot:CAMPEP_0177771586 /NCGR_PEP_ID=MMETSP0491_2-20121128/11689_1 /TAXON_ID=63592 /ORGANISM="Tetraselmis chuii, Strain PLY429" /LENGTH=79 /DNA_ID=CAMNT_0019289181 /DNA_START=344 /DNA_END=586 /DNA_ORIENTATION=-